MTFGQRPTGVVVPDPVKVGDRVRVLAGRSHGATADVVALDDPPTPSGSSVHVALIRLPRAGERWEFMHLLERVEP